MKNLTVWLVLLVVLSVSAISTVHWKGIEESDRKVSRLQPIYERQGYIDQMLLNLEKYRRTSSLFRKMTPSEMASAKEHLRSSFSQNLTQLDQLDSTPNEKALTAKLDDQLNQFLAASAKLEPMLFLKDAYHDPAIVDMHDGMLKSLNALNRSAHMRIETLGAQFSHSSIGSMRVIEGISVLIVLFVLMILGRDYAAFVRPLRKLQDYAAKLREEKGTPQPRPGLKGVHGEIEAILNELVLTVESQRKDRHKFIQDIVDDLKSPLAMLKEGRSLGTSEADESSQLRAADSVRRGLALLSGSLDDLGDILNLNRLQGQLEERMVDLTELVSDTARELSGGSMSKSITVTAPPMPVWVMIDSKRFERILVQVLSKMASSCPTPGSRIQITITQPAQGGFRGIELLLQEVDQNGTKARLAGSGPEQDLLRHWISEKGFGMALVHKIIKAHGGTVAVSGVAGSSVQFRIRLPQDRVGSGLLSPTSTASMNESARAAKLGIEVSPLTHAPFGSEAPVSSPRRKPGPGTQV